MFTFCILINAFCWLDNAVFIYCKLIILSPTIVDMKSIDDLWLGFLYHIGFNHIWRKFSLKSISVSHHNIVKMLVSTVVPRHTRSQIGDKEFHRWEKQIKEIEDPDGMELWGFELNLTRRSMTMRKCKNHSMLCLTFYLIWTIFYHFYVSYDRKNPFRFMIVLDPEYWSFYRWNSW